MIQLGLGGKKDNFVFLLIVIVLIILVYSSKYPFVAIGGSSFDSAVYTLLEDNQNNVKILARFSPESVIDDNGCDGESNYPLPSDFGHLLFRHSDEADISSQLDDNYYPITDFRVNDGVYALGNSCTDYPKTNINVDTIFNSGECRAVEYEGGTALDCRNIDASLTPDIKYPLKEFRYIEIEVVIPKKNVNNGNNGNDQGDQQNNQGTDISTLVLGFAGIVGGLGWFYLKSRKKKRR